MHQASSVSNGAGSQAVMDYLHSHAGDDFAVVEVERAEGRFTLILDAEWVRLAQSAHARNTDLVADMELPRASLLAVIAGWHRDWDTTEATMTIDYSIDDIPHLRLTGRRPSTTGADGRSRP